MRVSQERWTRGVSSRGASLPTLSSTTPIQYLVHQHWQAQGLSRQGHTLRSTTLRYFCTLQHLASELIVDKPASRRTDTEARPRDETAQLVVTEENSEPSLTTTAGLDARAEKSETTRLGGEPRVLRRMLARLLQVRGPVAVETAVRAIIPCSRKLENESPEAGAWGGAGTKGLGGRAGSAPTQEKGG